MQSTNSVRCSTTRATQTQVQTAKSPQESDPMQPDRPKNPVRTLRFHQESTDYQPTINPQPGTSSHWLIDGYPATITIWTAIEWRKIPAERRPGNTQTHDDGSHVDLRIA
jgi:hypothetical protein